MALFQKNAPTSPKLMYQQRYNSARYSLLLVVIFTAINCIMCAFGSDSYFLFSASIPYFIALTVAMYCGVMPDYYYTPDYGFDPSMEFLDISVLYITLAVCLLFCAVYALCYFMSSKGRKNWLLGALVMFVIDTVGMILLFGLSLDSAIDIIFHVFVIYSLASGLNASSKLKAIAAEEEAELLRMAEQAEENADTAFEYPSDSDFQQ